jgi:hypothetical protein
MKRNPTPGNPYWSISFGVVALSPLIVVAVVSIGFLIADVIKTL